MKTKRPEALLIAVVIAFLPSMLHAQWVQINGPSGGTVTTFAATDTYLFAGTGGLGIYRSSDNGETWMEVNTGLRDSTVSALAVRGDYVFAATYGGLFRSSDNGANWTESTIGTNRQSMVAVCFAVEGRDMYAGAPHGAYHSTDDGTTWMPIDTGLFSNNIMSLDVDGGNLYAGTMSGVWRSSDKGANWTKTHADVIGVDALRLGVTGATIFAGMVYGMNRSTDGGATWAFADDGLPYGFRANVSDLVVNDSVVIAGFHQSGVFRSTDNGETWSAFDEGLTSLNIRALAITDRDIYASITDGGVWRRSLTEIASEVEAEFSLPASASGIAIYPNPVSSLLTLVWHLETRTAVTITICDATGRIVSQPVVDAVQESGDHQIVLETGGLAAGVYLCSVNAGGVESSVRFGVVR